MPAIIKTSEIDWKEPVRIQFGFFGLGPEYALPIMRTIIQDNWPEIRRCNQCVYVIRLLGEVAVDYPGGFSPVIYIGEGSAYNRLYNHANWLTSLVSNVPHLGIEVHIAEVARRNHDTLYQYIEADLLRWFAQKHQSLPWFNRQRESSKENQYHYEHEAEQELRRHIGVGNGKTFLWAIKPTHNNEQHDAYTTGLTDRG